MSIREALENNLRARVQRNLDRTNVVLVELIRAPINQVSGQLAAGITVDAWQENGTAYQSTARSLAPYSVFVDRGTGIYPPGGRGSEITPTSEPLLKFYWYKAGGWRSMKSVRGMPAQNFFSEPMRENFESALQTAWGP